MLDRGSAFHLIRAKLAVACWVLAACWASAGCCLHSVPSTCAIGDVIRPAGASNPDNPCESCQPTLDPLGWSAAGGASCDAGPSAGMDSGVGAGSDGGIDAREDAGTLPRCLGDGGIPGCLPGPASDFASRAIYGSGIWSTLESADLNRDGILDLVAASYLGPAAPSSGLDVFLGQADGRLGPPAHYAGADGSGIAIGDLDGDGFPDVVASDGTDVNVFLSLGDGSLSTPRALGIGHYIGGLGLGDVNGDGTLDLVLGELTSGAELRLNEGAGVLGTSVALPASQGGFFGGVAVVDLNGDGLADVAMSAYDAIVATHTGWTVLLSKPNGGFEATAYPGSQGSIAVVDRGDCPPDLATVSDDGQGISVFQNRGDGHFAPPISYALPMAGATYLIAGDFNGDCLPDLAVSTSYTSDSNGSCDHASGAAWVLYGQSDSSFAEAVKVKTNGKAPLGLTVLGPAQAPRDLALADWCSAGLTVVGGPIGH